MSVDDNLPIPSNDGHDDAPAPISAENVPPSDLPPPIDQQGWQPPPWNEAAGNEVSVGDANLAGYGWRVIGLMVDGLILSVATALVALGGAIWVTWTFSIAAGILYPALLIAQWDGATVGMKLVGIRCVDAATQGPVTMSQSFVRSVGAGVIRAVALVIPFGALLQVIDLAWPIWDKRNQTLHDKIGRTVVLRPTKVAAV